MVAEEIKSSVSFLGLVFGSALRKYLHVDIHERTGKDLKDHRIRPGVSGRFSHWCQRYVPYMGNGIIRDPGDTQPFWQRWR